MLYLSDRFKPIAFSCDPNHIDYEQYNMLVKLLEFLEICNLLLKTVATALVFFS